MKFSLSWLRDHLDTQADVQEIAATFNAIGFEVEEVEDPAFALRDITVAEVREVAQHPQADRLHVCKVFDGQQTLQIVCGAKNVREGLKTALVHVGGFVPKLGDTLKKAKLRGVESCGMMCSCTELGLEDDGRDGIMELSEDAQLGTPLADLVGAGDPVFTICVTPNRGDCFSVRGLARELAAAGLGQLRPLDSVGPLSDLPPLNGSAWPESPTPISVETPHCPFFVGAVVTGVHNGPSPSWMQERLKVAGQRPIDALVDITNYLMFDRGQPTHIYDRRQIQGTIHIRSAQEGEQLQVLNGQDCQLTTKDMVIADDAKALTLAGIMGGEASGCAADTTDVLFEAGYFDPVSVTLTGQSLNLTSESRTRFERGVDPAGTRPCLEVGLALIQKICGGTVAGCSLARSNAVPEEAPQTATLSLAKLKGLSGDDTLTLEDAATILEKLGFVPTVTTAESLTVQVLSWRHDIFGEADLVEEVLRMRGYDRLPLRPLPLKRAQTGLMPLRCLKRILCARGFNEAYTLPFRTKAEADVFAAKGEEALEVLKPLNADKPFLQTSLVPALLQVVSFNQSRHCEHGAVFELESVFSKRTGECETSSNTALPAALHEEKRLCGIRFGKTPAHWAEPSRAVTVFDVKADLVALLDFLKIRSYEVVAEDIPAYLHPGRSGKMMRGRECLATFGELHPRWVQQFDVTEPVVLFELRLSEALFAKLNKEDLGHFVYSPLQPVDRDFAFVVDASVPAQKVVDAILKADSSIRNVAVFDVFEGPALGEGKKSLASRVTLQPVQKTFTDEDLQTISQNIIQHVKAKCGGELRD